MSFDLVDAAFIRRPADVLTVSERLVMNVLPGSAEFVGRQAGFRRIQVGKILANLRKRLLVTKDQDGKWRAL